MNLYDFIKLNEAEQAEAVWNGTFIADRVDSEARYLLYNLGSFFVEVSYLPKENKIDKLRPFKTKTLLEPYLDSIHLNLDESA